MTETIQTADGITIRRHTSPVKAIGEFCKQVCMCGSASEVKLCVSTACPLFPFRQGRNPYHRRRVTAEQRQAATQRLRRLHASRRAALASSEIVE